MMGSTKKKHGDAIVEDKKGAELHGVDNPADAAVGEVNLAIEEPTVNGKHASVGERETPPGQREDLEPEDDLQSRMWVHIDSVTGDFIENVKQRKKEIQTAVILLLVALWLAYLIWAIVYNIIDTGNIRDTGIILGLTIFCGVAYLYVLVRDNFGESLWAVIGKPTLSFVERVWTFGKWFFVSLIILGVGVGLYFLNHEDPEHLVSAFGLLVFILFTYIFSKHPRHVKWRPVLWGLALQFIFGILILRTQAGFTAFSWLGNLVSTILAYTDVGSAFIFGSGFREHFFAFAVLPVVIYFSAVISLLYHIGVMQVIIKKIAWLMQNTMKTSATESLNAAGNIFVGQTEAPLMIRPLLKDMTKSELHAVMAGGFATIAGSVLGAYIAFGISASHLLSASVMSAPAALAIAKLFYPETRKSSTKTVDQINLLKSEHRNVVEAASYGAYTGVPLALNIAGNLIAFLAILALFDGVLGYLGGLVGHPEFSFMFICGYVFQPIAWLMGVEPKDCRMVAELIGAKTFINEFYAYDLLSELIKNRINGVEPYLTIRSEVITTYALCGFSNIGAIGIQLGGLTPMAPERKSDLASVAVRAMIAGSIACFMTACIAGILYDQSTYDAGSIIMLMGNTTTLATPAAMTTNVRTTGGSSTLSISNMISSFYTDISEEFTASTV